MSKFKQTIKDVKSFLEAATTKGYEVREGQNLVVKQFGSNVVPNAVAAVKLPGWGYEVAVDSEGAVVYDHFGSKANTFELLGGLVQDYNQTITMRAAPLYDVANYYTKDKANGDKVLVLEYD